LNIRIVLLLVLMLPGFGWADSAGNARSAYVPTLRLHEQAEELYSSGHFQRAYFIYVNELAAIGDKYAQYMAGYMNHYGKGVPRNLVQASAWYRLAAEQGAPQFVELRDQVLESMSEDMRLESDAEYLALRQKYGDLVLAMAQLRELRELRNERSTGSHLSSNSSAAVTVVDPRTGVTISRTEYMRRIESRMQVLYDHISGRLGIAPLEPGLSDREFEALTSQVDNYLQRIDDR
jgi:hypothetical protein